MDELWYPIRNYSDLYLVSTKGNVHSIRRNRTIGSITTNGYKSVVLCKKGIKNTFLIHRLVAKTFIPNPKNKPEVNHKDGNKLNNDYSNLEWSTSTENNIHAIQNRLRTKFKGISKKGLKVLDTTTGKEYKSIKECADEHSLKDFTLHRYLTGKRKSKFPNLKLITNE